MSHEEEKPGALRILVADDNNDQVVSLRVLLEMDGHIVCTLDSGAKAVETVQEFRPNVCIFDIDMPVASGYAIGRQLKHLYGPERPVMIAISGKWYRGADRVHASDVGFDHFLEKPADPRELCRILDDVSRRLAPH